MKKIILMFILTTGFFLSKQATSQVSVSINIGSQPAWGPVGYDYVEYYYIPDIEVYYFVPRGQYVYLSNGRWIFSTYLPVRHRSYNLYSGYKVVINGPRPYLHFSNHKVVYAKYKGNNGRQVIIKNSNDPKYYVVKGHPKYSGGANKAKVSGQPATKSNGNNGHGKSGSSKGKGKN